MLGRHQVWRVWRVPRTGKFLSVFPSELSLRHMLNTLNSHLIILISYNRPTAVAAVGCSFRTDDTAHIGEMMILNSTRARRRNQWTYRSTSITPCAVQKLLMDEIKRMTIVRLHVYLPLEGNCGDRSVGEQTQTCPIIISGQPSVHKKNGAIRCIEGDC